jgi:thioredoxin-like negative regulator of GroEL
MEGQPEPERMLQQLQGSSQPFFLYFGSLSCAVCQAVKPQLFSLAAEYQRPVIDIDVAQQAELAGQHLVFTVPTVLLFYQGREILRESRCIDFARIERNLELLQDEPE